MEETLSEKFDRYLESDYIAQSNRQSGLQSHMHLLTQVVSDIGGYQSILDFLSDNPGACDQLIDFVRDFATRPGDRWADNLESVCENEVDCQEDDYDDGQPDEAQEWHDFDSDC